MEGLIFSVKKYSVHDGPGIRITFFMKGCPLKCLWCHNPEGISPFPETVTRTNKIGDREFNSDEEAGKYYSVESVMEIIGKEKVFMKHSNGGVTFSGGEPMMQADFLLSTLKACRDNGYHTAIDTSGYASAESFKAVIPFTNLFLFDIKHLDDSKHIEITGVSNKDILKNFKLLAKSGKDIMIRIPVIPGFNDDMDHLFRLRDFISASKTDSIKRINLLPFHKIGASKYQRFKMPYRMGEAEPPGKERMQALKEFFIETGINVKIGG